MWQNFNDSNTDGSYTVADSMIRTRFFCVSRIFPIASENKYLGIFKKSFILS